MGLRVVREKLFSFSDYCKDAETRALCDSKEGQLADPFLYW